jgi:flagellar protein FliO/FliZ
MAQDAQSVAQAINPIGSNSIMDVLLGLAFIIILIFFLAWAFKKFGSGSLGLGGLIKVVAAMSLGGRDRIALISVGDKQLLLGISPGRIATLHVFDEPIKTVSSMEKLTAAKGEMPQDFAGKLQSMLSGSKS